MRYPPILKTICFLVLYFITVFGQCWIGCCDVLNGFEQLWTNKQESRLLGFNVFSQVFRSIVGNYGEASKPRQMHRTLIIFMRLMDIVYEKRWNEVLHFAKYSIKYMDDTGIFGQSKEIVDKKLKAIQEVGYDTFGLPMKDSKTVWGTQHAENLLGFQVMTDLKVHRVPMLDVSANRKAKLEHKRAIICSGKPYPLVALDQWAGSAYSISELRYPMKAMVRYVSRRRDHYLALGFQYGDMIDYCPFIAASVDAFHRGYEGLGPIPLEDYKFTVEFKDLPASEYDVVVWTDASDYGFGGYVGTTHEWFYGGFSKADKARTIHWKEAMTPLAWLSTILKTNPELVTGKKVLIFVDNKSVGYGWANKKYKEISVDSVLQMIFSLMIKYKIFIFTRYIKSKQNYLADSLSRWNVQNFKDACRRKHFTFTPRPISVSIPSVIYPK